MAKTRKKNPFGKSRTVDNPYAVYKMSHMNYEWRVLKTYKLSENEAKNPYSAWFVAARSDMSYGSWEYGDTYIQDIVDHGTLVEATQEWINVYRKGVEL